MIETSPISTQQDENRQAFLRYLPKRIEAFEHRIRRYSNEGWDPTGMMVLRGDVQRLAEASGRYSLTESKRHLAKLAQRVGEHLAKRSTPNSQQTLRMFEQLAAVVTESQSLLPESQPHSTSAETVHATDVSSGVPAATHERIETAEPGELAEPVASVGLGNPTQSMELARPVQSMEPIAPATPAEPSVSVEPDMLLEPDEPAGSGEAGVRRIYHLSDGNPFATALGQRLESDGYVFEPLETVDELSELVMCLLPHVLLVDASHMSDLTAIGRLRLEAQQRSRRQRRFQVVVMAAEDGMETRRTAHRAGVDLLLTPPFDINDIVNQLHALHTSATEQKVRVLIVEDNRADAFYAQTVLINAGMQAHVEQDPLKVLESLNLLHPDLILMDLHMPFANGVEVTLLIREHPVFARVPIVFLSGESDPDSRLEAINAGGDDFLFKPIRPKHLVAAVRDRMRRMHPVSKQGVLAGASSEAISA